MIQHGSACPLLEKFANIIRIFSIPASHYSHPVPWKWHSSISLFFILHLIHIYFPMETYLWNNCDKREGTHWKVSFLAEQQFHEKFQEMWNYWFCLQLSIFKIKNTSFFSFQSSFSFPLPTLITTSSQLFLHMLARESTMFRYFFQIFLFPLSNLSRLQFEKVKGWEKNPV